MTIYIKIDQTTKRVTLGSTVPPSEYMTEENAALWVAYDKPVTSSFNLWDEKTQELVPVSDWEYDQPDAPTARAWRNQELKSTDIYMVEDFPCDKTAWRTYRQQLRDWPQTESFPLVRPVRPISG